MGNCISIRNKITPPPTIVAKISKGELFDIIRTQLKINDNSIYLPDKNYALYPMSDLQKFLTSNAVDKLQFQTEKFDCDDFACVLKGYEREWFSTATIANSACGSTFGIVWGDIRKTESDTDVRNHAVNYFMDENKTIWLIEPQTDGIMRPTSNSTFYVAM